MLKDWELKKHKFIVFCEDHYNPLGVIRSLGEAGIRTIVILIKPRSLNYNTNWSRMHYDITT